MLHCCTFNITLWRIGTAVYFLRRLYVCPFSSACSLIVSQNGACRGRYPSRLVDLCCCLKFHGFVKEDESGAQWWRKEMGEGGYETGNSKCLYLPSVVTSNQYLVQLRKNNVKEGHLLKWVTLARFVKFRSQIRTEINTLLCWFFGGIICDLSPTEQSSKCGN